MAESAVSGVVGRIGNLAIREASQLCAVTGEVEFLKDELARLQGFLKDADSKMRSGNASIAIWVRQIRDASYDAENIIEAAEYVKKRNMLQKGIRGAVSRYACLPGDLASLHKVNARIRRVRRKVGDIKDSMSGLNIANLNFGEVEKSYIEDDMLTPHNIEDNVVVVGFESEYKELVEKLLDQASNLTVVSLVAMGGAGKTTLTRKVYNSSRIKEHFEAAAWVTVSQKLKGIELMKDMMTQIMGSTDDSGAIDQMQEKELGRRIYDFLLQKRYLLVLDDVWETDTWNQINRVVQVFPDVNNGSRLLLTTRKSDAARHIQMPTYVHHLKLLDEERSWELFSHKALPSYRRSSLCNLDEFELLGRKFARKCDGLPLALAVLGGYLSKNLNVEAWLDALSSWTTTKDGHLMGGILARSYEDLPNHYLKSCFLYLAAFPEDYDISVSDLIELWIAECFIPHSTKHRPEETARMYVTELAQRSLVQVVRRSRAHGWIEEIRIHDILRDWCIEQARQDGFLDIIDKTAGHVGASSSYTMISYRSSFQNFCDDEFFKEPYNLRTFVGFGLPSVSLPKLRFLRVLHIENSNLKNFSSAIGGCIHLRCLRLRRCNTVKLSSSIGQLLYLQTIDLWATKLDFEVPNTLWGIPALRHVYLKNGFCPPRNVEQKELQTLWLNLSAVDKKYFCRDMLTFFGQLTQLRAFILNLIHIPAEMLNIFVSIPHLVEINLARFDVLDRLPESHRLPQYLRQLCLLADVIKQDPMPILEKLPCLVVLVLQGYEGRTMFCSAQGFPRLQQLELGGFSTEEWMMEVGTMPRLSRLTFSSCEKMSMLPEGLMHLVSLKEMYLLGMSQISRDDNIWKELQGKGCKVSRRLKVA